MVREGVGCDGHDRDGSVVREDLERGGEGVGEMGRGCGGRADVEGGFDSILISLNVSNGFLQST